MGYEVLNDIYGYSGDDWFYSYGSARNCSRSEYSGQETWKVLQEACTANAVTAKTLQEACTANAVTYFYSNN